MENFQEIADQFRSESAMVQVASPDELAREVSALLLDERRRRGLGDRARDLVGRNRGAVRRTTDALASCWREAPPGLGLRRARLVARRRVPPRATAARSPRRARRERGNLGVGGSGKTPVVARVAEILRDAGERVAVLSRGTAGASAARRSW